MRVGACFAAGLMLLAARAEAETDPICASRPGSSTPTCIVPAGHWQVETGLADWTRDSTGGATATELAIGETAIRYGLATRSELIIDITPFVRAASRSGGVRDSISGFGDVTVGFKQLLTEPDAAVQLALLPVVKIPTAGHDLGNGKWEGGLLLPVAIALGKSPLSIGLTPEVDWVADGDGSGHHAAMTQVASLGWAASDRLSLSAELWAQWDWDPSGTASQASANGSIAYLVGNNVQLDGGANFGLNAATPDVELYAGVSVRF